MKQIISEYGGAILSMVSLMALISLVTALVFGPDSPFFDSITKFANEICGG